MPSFDTLTSPAVPLVLDNLDTDQIFPARFSSRSRDDGGFGDFFLHDHRFDEAGRKHPGFILNHPRMAGASILVASENYACGSGRAGALHAHVDFGIRAIVAESFGSVFSAVAYKSGLLAIQLPRRALAPLREQLLHDIGATVTIDLPDQTILAPDGTVIPFDVDPFVKRLIMSGLSEIDLTLALGDRLRDFDALQRQRLPWVFAAP